MEQRRCMKVDCPLVSFAIKSCLLVADKADYEDPPKAI